MASRFLSLVAHFVVTVVIFLSKVSSGRVRLLENEFTGNHLHASTASLYFTRDLFFKSLLGHKC